MGGSQTPAGHHVIEPLLVLFFALRYLGPALHYFLLPLTESNTGLQFERTHSAVVLFQRSITIPYFCLQFLFLLLRQLRFVVVLPLPPLDFRFVEVLQVFNVHVNFLFPLVIRLQELLHGFTVRASIRP